MEYVTPELRRLGSFASLTLGENGSCPDGNGRNNTQLGGGNVIEGGNEPCGSSSGDTGETNTGGPNPSEGQP